MFDILREIEPGKFLITDERQLNRFITEIIEEFTPIAADYARFNCRSYFKSDPKTATNDVLMNGILKFLTSKHIDTTCGCIVGIEGKGQLINILRRIWRNCAIDLNRKNNTKSVQLQDYVDMEEHISRSSHPVSAPYIRELIGQDTLNEILDCLKQQNVKHLVEVFRSFVVEDLDYEEIGQKLGITTKSCYNLMNRARKIIKQKFGNKLKGLDL